MAGSGEQAGPRLAAVLEGLALQQVRGVVEIDGDPGGAVYLDQGHITFARASWTPNLVARLSGALQPDATVREMLMGADRPDRDVSSALIDGGYLTAAGLGDIVRSTVIDAMLALTVPLAEEASIAGIRFESGKTHWAQSLCRVPVSVARAEALRRAERMAGYALADTARLELRDAPDARHVLRPEQWAIACKINGTWSARDLAWRCGFALYETVEHVGDLVRAGLCAPAQGGRGPAAQRRRPAGVRHDRRPQRPVPSPPLSAAAAAAADHPVADRDRGGPGTGVPPAMPVRRPGATAGLPPAPAGLAAGTAGMAGDGPEAGDGQFVPMPAESLRRVLDGLRRLN